MLSVGVGRDGLTCHACRSTPAWLPFPYGSISVGLKEGLGDLNPCALIMDPLSYSIQIFREQAVLNNWVPLIREARQLSQPITSRGDELVLIQALAIAHVQRHPEQEALRRLHGVCIPLLYALHRALTGLEQVNSHAENIWRTYYSNNRARIDLSVSAVLQRLRASQA